MPVGIHVAVLLGAQIMVLLAHLDCLTLPGSPMLVHGDLSRLPFGSSPSGVAIHDVAFFHGCRPVHLPFGQPAVWSSQSRERSIVVQTSFRRRSRCRLRTVTTSCRPSSWSYVVQDRASCLPMSIFSTARGRSCVCRYPASRRQLPTRSGIRTLVARKEAEMVLQAVCTELWAANANARTASTARPKLHSDSRPKIPTRSGISRLLRSSSSRWLCPGRLGQYSQNSQRPVEDPEDATRIYSCGHAPRAASCRCCRCCRARGAVMVEVLSRVFGVFVSFYLIVGPGTRSE